MTALAIHRNDPAEARRWALSAAVVIGCHAGAVALGLYLQTREVAPGIPMPAMTIDLAPAVSASPSQQVDIAPGPDMQQADAPLPESPETLVQETPPQTLMPTPLQERPEVVAPIESRLPTEPARPDPVQVERIKPKPEPPRPKPMRSETRRTSESRPAPRSTALPKAQRQSPPASSAVAGASSAYALACYNQIVAAHLQRFKQYPAAARGAGERGIARVSFTLGRNGQVLGSSLAGSSGFSTLDHETVSMVRRAQPFPPMPADIKQATMRFVVPVAFTSN